MNSGDGPAPGSAPAEPEPDGPQLLRATRVALWTLGVAAVLVSALFVWRRFLHEPAPARVPDLVASAAASHQELVRGELALELATRSPDAVNRFLLDALDVPLGTLGLQGGWRVEGARACRLSGVDVGQVVLRDGERPVSLFVVPPAAALHFPDALDAARRSPSYRVGADAALLQAAGKGLRCAVGEIEPARLARLLGTLP